MCQPSDGEGVWTQHEWIVTTLVHARVHLWGRATSFGHATLHHQKVDYTTSTTMVMCVKRTSVISSNGVRSKNALHVTTNTLVETFSAIHASLHSAFMANKTLQCGHKLTVV